MSSASNTAFRSNPPPRYTLFLPMLILLFGSGALALYQVMSMEDRLDKVTQAVDKLDGRVKRAQDEKTKFYSLVKGVLLLAPKDPNAEQVAVYFKLRQLQAAQPALMDLNAPTTPDETGITAEPPPFATNAAPIESSAMTNTTTPFFPGPAGK